MNDQLSLKELTDPFTGKPVKEGEKAAPEEGAAKGKSVLDKPIPYPFKGETTDSGPL